MPSPPSSLDKVTVVQATRQCPPFASLFPFHRKALLSLSIASIFLSGHLAQAMK